MQLYEYKVVPAPNHTRKVKGVKTPAGRFAVVLTDVINEEAAAGWEYLRSDSLPVEEKPGLLKQKVENYYTVLVFRRPVEGAAEDAAVTGGERLRAMPIPTPDGGRIHPLLGRPVPSDDDRSDPPLSVDDEADEVAEASETDKADGSPFAEPGDTDKDVIR